MRVVIRICIALLVVLLLQQVWAQAAVTAEATAEVNIRSDPAVWGAELGKMTIGTQYPVIGRSEFTPWALIADPATNQPIGWVFIDIVTIRGPLDTLPLSAVTVTENMPTLTPAVPVGSAGVTPGALTPVAPATLTLGPGPTSTQAALSGVTGVVAGEVNIRYGPGADFPRVGVAQAGNTFEILATHSQADFVQVRYENAPGRVAWIAKSLIEITGDLTKLPVITDSLTNLPTLTPTSSVVNASVRPGAEGTQTPVPVNPAFAALGEQLAAFMLGQNFDPATERFGALFVLDLQTKEAFTFGNTVAFSGTSVNKIAILARLYGTLNNPPDRMLATDIANTMICSENVATNRLLNTIGAGDEFKGAEEVTRFLNQLGLNRSFLLTPYVTDPAKPPVPPRPLPIPITGANQTKANPDLTNQLTVEDMGWLLEDIYECGYENSGPLLQNFGGAYDSRECRQMLHVMSNNTVDALLKAGVPADTRVAHKHGWIPDTHSNAAVFFTPGGDYIVVMMVFQPEWLDFSESLPTMAEISREIYNYYNPETPMTAIREGFIPTTESCNFAGSPLVEDLMQLQWDQ